MRIVYVAPFLGVPPDNGGAIRAYNLVRYLAQSHQVTVVTWASDQQEALSVWASKYLDRLIILPSLRRDSSSQDRATTLRRMLAFPSESFRHFPSKLLVSAVEQEFQRETQPDIIIFDTLYTGQAIRLRRWLVPTILSLYDVESNYSHQMYAKSGWRPYKFVYGLEWLKTWLYERQIVRSFQTIAVVSPQDAVAIQKMHPAAQVLYVPNGVDTHIRVPLSEMCGDAILFVGNFDYAPNVEGLWYFYEEIWQKIRAHVDARFLLVGRNPPRQFFEISQSDPSVEIAANVPDVRPYYAQARVCVVPLQSGEGTRLKILEAFNLGIPVVSTSIGCEGLDVVDGESLMIANDSDTFARNVIGLFQNRTQAEAMVAKARMLVENRYDWNTIGCNYQAELERLVN
ncbi:MAG: glycosyltransferase [Chloroflexi bacterium]|nr:glycosyltransferase [Chloroflexota bacterium]